MSAVQSAEKPNKPRETKQWEVAQALFLAGTGVHEIAQKLNIPLGTVKARAYRDRWVQIRNQARPTLTEIRMTRTQAFVEGRNDGMEERGRKLRQQLSIAVHDQLGRLPSYEPSTLRDELDVATILGKAACVASTVHGWDRESVTSTVRVGAMGEEEAGEEIGEGESPLVQVTASQAAQ